MKTLLKYGTQFQSRREDGPFGPGVKLAQQLEDISIVFETQGQQNAESYFSGDLGKLLQTLWNSVSRLTERVVELEKSKMDAAKAKDKIE